ncbi:hypothetical protein F8178_08765 [Haloechinothrix sp. LS1_15]|nr:hypothetical protein [Haloechinothrix sp. LS1_15]
MVPAPRAWVALVVRVVLGVSSARWVRVLPLGVPGWLPVGSLVRPRVVLPGVLVVRLLGR